ALTRFVLPTPAPSSVNIFACSLIHFLHSARIFVSAAFLFSGSVFFQSSITDRGARYVTKYLFMHPPLAASAAVPSPASQLPRRLQAHLQNYPASIGQGQR